MKHRVRKGVRSPRSLLSRRIALPALAAAAIAVAVTRIDGIPRQENVLPRSGRPAGSASSGSAAEGRELYAKNCYSCHGEAGRGDGPSGLFLKQKPSDLGSAPVRKMSDDELYSRITEGKQPMPGFGKKLTDEERWALVHYVRSLAQGGP